MSEQNSRLFSALQVAGHRLRNRIVLPPMCQYMADGEGLVNEYHLAHYGVRALSGAALIILEATAVQPDGRLSGSDLGLWSEQQVAGQRQLATAIAAHGCLPGIQLNHAGRKAWPGATRRIAPSAIAYSADYGTPQQMSEQDMDSIRDSFVQAARWAVMAGYKVIELHAAHGYLLAQFLSPLSNQREDQYGGNATNRLRFPLQVVDAVKAALPEDVLLAVRLSADEYTADGVHVEDTVHTCQQLEQHGVQLLHISSGGNVPIRPEVWPGYQLPYAKAVKDAVSVPVIGVGLLQQPALAEFALREGYCDLVAVGRGYLHDPHWAITAAKQLGEALPVPESMQKALLR